MEPLWPTYYRGPLGRAIEAKDYAFVAVWLSSAWDEDLSAKKVTPWVVKTWGIVSRWRDLWPSDETLTMILKNRAAESGLFGVSADGSYWKRYGCPLHVFFISLEETEEQLTRLRKPEKLPAANPATSGIERTQLAEIHPIDRVAQRVI